MTHSRNLLLIIIATLLLIFQLGDFVECWPTETAFCQNFVRSRGYDCEEHKMYTDDGFALLLHRVGIVQQNPEDGGSSGKMGDIQYNLKVALSHGIRKKDRSKLIPVVKFSGEKQISAAFEDDFASHSAQPYQSANTYSDSGPGQQSPAERGATLHRNIGGDARNSPENLPISVQPYLAADPTNDVGHSSSVQPYVGLPHEIPVSSSDGPQNPWSSAQPFVSLDRPIPASSSGGPQNPWSQEALSPSVQPTPSGGFRFTPYGPLPDIHNPLPAEISSPAPSWTINTPAIDASAPETTVVLRPPLDIPGEIPGEIPGVIPGTIPGVIPGFIPGETQLPPGVVSRHPFSPASSGPEIPGIFQGPIDQTPSFLGPVVPDPTTTAPPLSDPLAASRSPELSPCVVVPEAFSPAPAGPPSISPIDCVDGWPEKPASGAKPTPEDGGSGSCVLLLHHELLNGDSWFKEVKSGSEPSHLLPFLLADDGFDVWVGHGRATYWGHDHVHLNSSNQDYWNWSWDEFVEHDLPKALVYINENSHSKVDVVGVSQSAAVAVAAAATQPDLARLMRSLVLVGPTIYRGIAAPFQWQTWAGIFAKVTDGPDSSSVSGQFNISRDFQMHSWSFGGPASQISGPDCCLSTPVTLFDNGWDGTTSYKNFKHFEQGVLTNTFQKFDYGSPSSNLEVYGQSQPPAYLPANLPADLPMQIIYGGNDFFSSPEGIQELLLSTPRLPATVYLPLYAHFDLFFSGTRKQDVYLPMRSFLRDPDAAT